MYRTLRTIFLFLLILIPAQRTPTALASGDQKPLQCAVLPVLVSKYLEGHVVYDKPTPELVNHAVDLMAKRLDPSKTLLTASEYREVKSHLRRIYRGMLRGRCQEVAWLSGSERKWHKEMRGFADKMLANDHLKIDRSVALQLDPDDRTRPKSTAEQNRLRRKLIQFQLASLVSGGISLKEAREKIEKRYQLAEKRADELDRQDYYTMLLDAYANGLDPHTTYFSPDALEDFRISMKLSLEGIGAVLTSEDGYTIVREIVPGGAADREGELKVNDKIIAVAQGENGEAEDVVDMALRDVVKLIRGKRGTRVRLVVLRKGEKTNRLELTITRDKIDIKQQAAKLRWEKVKRHGAELKLAIIDLPSFYGGDGGRHSAKDMRKLLREAKDGGADGVLLDLSRNGGGLLDAAVKIAGLFLVKGAVVGVESPDGREVLKDRDATLDYDGPLVVLTSRVSASASEIFAGVMQDYHRAVIAGDDHTFGKGTVQNVVSLPPGLGALKVTQGMFYLPGGYSTQSRGVRSDVRVPSPFAASDIGEANQSYSLPPRKISPFKSKTVNSSSGFVPVTQRQIRVLARRSKHRQAKNPEFRELAKNLRKQKHDDGVVKISELFDDHKESADDDEKDDDKKLSPQAKEAVQILADLAMMDRRAQR